ncbi:hypothetical protein [Listeria rocourtiae]|uniref:hypothetical protein n=1 Tax=Listeria rocourtiae TaxID=647910 RepID=UPI003D2F685F
MDKILKEFEKRYGQRKINQITTEALEEASKVVKKDMQEAFKTFADTGASKDEIIITFPRIVGGVKQVKLGWNGPKDRWRLIHLNENGYTKTGRRYTPKGMGTIRKTIVVSKGDFLVAVRKALIRHL